MIKISELTKAFASYTGKLTVFEKFSLQFRQGEIVALVGPSGCGKSTLVRICAGLELPDQGTVAFDAAGVSGVISIVFQDHGLLEWLTAADNVSLAAKLRNFALDDQHSRELLQRVGLAGFEDAYPDELSGGMKSRVALARALAIPSSIVLLDEPFRSLDEITRRTVSIDATRLLRSRGQTVLMVTHSVSEAVRLADRIVVVSSRPMAIVNTIRVDLSEKERFALDCEAARSLIQAVSASLLDGVS